MEPFARHVATSGLRQWTALDPDNVGGVVESGAVHEGGAHIARQVTRPGDGPTGVFLSENGGTYPW